MNRDSALQLLKKYIQNDQLIKHSLATEAIMRKLAVELDEDPERWGMIGLLHDLDFDQTKDNPEKHTVIAAKLLTDNGFDQNFIDAVQSHNAEELGLERKTTVEFALTAAESITGLIVATTLVYPEKKIAAVKSKSIRKRMKAKAFARAVSRERILECEQLGVEFPRFVEISLTAMGEISDELGL
ncbi:HDIG domain-containing metalloprotein [candidate division CSSED10-310 bacterium]|uniref:HDIG domain-containing metalloprotein n=1 Tax=candidate division CSSED10-310 bacterium TaxID=2855610 RepID=A0ABV6Z3A0_UNCC1